ncbi:MAG: 2,3-bisphosphoglycerate-independent phosphoglycerate mutase [Flavobacteriales bacterium]|nr:2,3-bisphosphoglycerate-independent phosphoglycerate mutase [Flavobacteriales bacterium]
MQNKVCLIIMDGWGIGCNDTSNAIFNANTPFVDSLKKNAQVAQLLTDGEHVGLPQGQMGNSEVGHMNIGAGRIVYQDLLRIDRAVASGDFNHEPILVNAFEEARKRGSKLHFMGLVSEGGVHSNQTHLHALCSMAAQLNVPAYIHAFTDGRDCDPHSAKQYVANLEQHIKDKPVKIASVIGRYYAMDRDKRWERVAEAYRLLTSGAGKPFGSAAEAIDASYSEGITDEFIKASVITEDGSPIATINPDDVVICFNFRTDRCREITMALTQEAYPEQGMRPIPLYYVTMTNYDKTFRDVHVVYDKQNLSMTLGEVLEKGGKTQVRIAETEKYPHVTFFFSGGREVEFSGESRILINSPKVATYDLQPEMSAPEVASAICDKMQKDQPDFICLNFANPDMVGHTGVFSAIVKAVETTDRCVQQVVECGQELGYSFVIIADHGNADFAVNDDGSPNTAHSLNPVPMYIIDNRSWNVESGILADVAPTVLKLMGVPQPEEMTGRTLIS